MLELWRSLTSGGDPSEIGDQARERREQLLHDAVNPELIGCLAERIEAFIRRGDDKLNALDTCYLLEQSTPLLLLNLVRRQGRRNQLHNGLQQSYGDHTRMLALAIDKLEAGDLEWYRTRLWSSNEIDESELVRCIDSFEQLGFDATCRCALWTAATLHDYGKLYGRHDGLDPEDGSALVDEIVQATPLWGVSALIQFVVRNHDAVEYIVTGETPREFLIMQLNRLDASLRPAAMAMLGIIQLAGAASLGEGRVIPKKLRLYRECLTNEILTGPDSRERLQLLSSDTWIPPHGFTTLVRPSSAFPGELADHERRFIQRVVLHGWHELRDQLHEQPGSQARRSSVLVRLIRALAEAWDSAGQREDHVIVRPSAVRSLLTLLATTTAPHVGSLHVKLGHRARSVALLNGSRALIVESNEGT